MSLAQLHRAVAFGLSGGKIIWQPRISTWYYDKVFENQALPEPYVNMTLPELYRALGVSPRIYEYNAAIDRVDDPRVRIRRETLNDTDTKTTVETPVGNQVAVHRSSTSNRGHRTLKWEVESREELAVAAWRLEHTDWTWDETRYRAIAATWGDLGAPTIYLPRITVQDLYLNRMGVERGVYALYDWPEEVEAYFDAWRRCDERLLTLVADCPVEIVNFGDNVHAGTLSPPLFEKHYLPECRRRCERLHAARKFCHAHWDGDTKPILKYARETGLDGIEAITPEPQGDVTLEQVKEALGDDVFLIDGIPAILFDDMFPEEQLIECTHRIIELFAPKLILGISDEISSHGNIDRVLLVKRIVDEYNERIESGKKADETTDERG